MFKFVPKKTYVFILGISFLNVHTYGRILPL